jgi:hypothetical protein
VNRVPASLVPLGLLPLLKTSGALVMFTVIAGVLVISALLVLAFGPRNVCRKAVE